MRDHLSSVVLPARRGWPAEYFTALAVDLRQALWAFLEAADGHALRLASAVDGPQAGPAVACYVLDEHGVPVRVGASHLAQLTALTRAGYTVRPDATRREVVWFAADAAGDAAADAAIGGLEAREAAEDDAADAAAVRRGRKRADS